MEECLPPSFVDGPKVMTLCLSMYQNNRFLVLAKRQRCASYAKSYAEQFASVPSRLEQFIHHCLMLYCS